MKFRSRKGYLIRVLLGFLLVLSIIVFSNQAYICFILLLAVISYIVWMWYDTYYLINGNQLMYKSALLAGSINISAIDEIGKNKIIYAGLKPSLSGKGLVVKYDDTYIFLSPYDIDRFISVLKKVNPRIKVIE